MKIAIDASRTTKAHVTGTEHYALALIRALITYNDAQPEPHHITLYFRDPPPPDLFPASPHVAHKIIPIRRVWTHLGFGMALWRDRPDVTFVPAHTLPFIFPGKAIATVHDLGFRYFPQAHPFVSRVYLDWTTPYSARRAKIVLVDSQATADDLARFYNINSDKMRVVYPGVEAPTIGDVDAVRQKYKLPKRYFLFIGTLQPRKNIARIVQAYMHYRASRANPAQLVLAGRKGWLFDEAWLADAEGVHVTGYIAEADKGALYAGAVGLAFTTLYEGFGFPVVEAMQCGTPVIASTTSSLPELVGEAGLLVDPTDINAIAGAMQRIDSDAGLRETLRERGYTQAQHFTWETATRQLWNALTTIGAQ